jgi:vacuolar-type H+-ATPase subunit F/Vma7
VSRIAALGEAVKVEGFALAGALVLAAEDATDVDAAWTALPDDVAVLILTTRAADRLGERLDERPRLITVVGLE